MCRWRRNGVATDQIVLSSLRPRTCRIIRVLKYRPGKAPAGLGITLIVHIASSLSVGFAAQNPISHYWHKITDPTFRGVYHANAFDLAMMIPYFIVLLVLAVYGLHRYWLVYDYFAYSNNVPPDPPPVTNLPRVTVQLPTFNHRYLIYPLVEATPPFHSPPQMLDVPGADDSTGG